MKIDNQTAYSSDDLRRIIQAVCTYDGFVPQAGAIVRVVYSRRDRFSGWATYGGGPSRRRDHGGAAMLLRLPSPKWGPMGDRMAKLLFIVRHEVGHWRGLRHRDMGAAYMEWPDAFAPIQEWAAPLDLQLRVVEEPKIAMVDRVARREDHARTMLAEHEAKLAREKRLVAKWRAKVRYYDRTREKKSELLAASPRRES